MADNTPKQQEIKIDLPPEVANGIYANLAVISHSGNEFFIDFINVGPNAQGRVRSRIIMTPENAKNLMFALNDNVKKYEQNFGTIQQKKPKNASQSKGEIPNPFIGGQA